MKFLRQDAGRIASDYRRGVRTAFRHSRGDVEYVLERGKMTIRVCRSCVWKPVQTVYVSSVEEGETGLAVNTRIGDMFETPGPSLLFPFFREAEQ